MIGSYHFYFDDLATVLAGMGLMLHLASRPKLGLLACCVLVLDAAALVNLVRGAAVSPFQATLSFRDHAELYIYGSMFIVLAGDRHASARYMPSFMFGAIMLVLLYLLRCVYGFDFLLRDVRIGLEQVSLENRYLNAEAAMFLGLTGMLFADRWLRSNTTTADRGLYGMLALAALGFELISRQRSATAATAAGIAGYFLSSPRSLRRVPPWLKTIGLLMIAIGITLFLLSSSAYLLSLLPESFQESLQKRATFDARQAIWLGALLEFASRGLVDQLFGYYSGRPPLLLTPDGLWTTSLHNQYLATLSYYGFVGLAAFVLLILGSAAGLIRAVRAGRQFNRAGISPPLAVAWFAALLIYGYAYEWVNVLTLFFAMSCAPWSIAPGPSDAPRQPSRRGRTLRWSQCSQAGANDR